MTTPVLLKEVALQSGKYSKLALIGFLAAVSILLFGAASAQASIIIPINSGAGVPWTTPSALSGCGGVSGFSVAITPESVWVPAPAGSSWISCKDNLTGTPGGASLATGTIVTFDQAFVLPAGPILGGSIKVAADDTTGVTLNGTSLFAANTTLGSTCANADITCTKLASISLPSIDLMTGTNHLLFDMRELDGNGSGLVYSGSVSVVPEPATFALMAPGVLGLVWLRRRRRKAEV